MGRLAFTAADRRRLLVSRHLLDGSGTSAAHVADQLVAIHATDPATPFLSVLARSPGSSIEDIASAMYEERSLVRWLAMRRTVFLFDSDRIPDIQAAVSDPLAAVLRRRLATLLTKNGALPDGTDAAAWVDDVEAGVRRALSTVEHATGAELSALEPRLRTPIPVRLPSDTRQTVTSALLAMMSAAGEIVRASPTGAWTSRQHRWQSADTWWPSARERTEPLEAAERIARRWLLSYGPATVDDLQWWTGWTKTTTRAALARLPVVPVDLDGTDGIDLAPEARAGGEAPETVGVKDERPAPSLALLPALDSTAMGWKLREWYSPADTSGLYDRFGNIGPTIWWNGMIVGAWCSTATGIRTQLLTDQGAKLETALDHAAERLEARLGGTVVTPAIRTPIERALSS